MTIVDLRPGALDLRFRSGNGFSLTCTWPTSLGARTFTAYLGSTALTTAVAGSVLTVTASEANSATVLPGSSAALTIHETTGGLDEVVITGRAVAETSGAGSPTSTSVTVTAASVAVAVTVAGPPGPAGPQGDPGSGGGTGGAVDSVNGHVGTVVLGASDVGADAAGAAAAEATARTTAVSAEATARANADTALAASIAAEATARATAVSTEASTRATADTTLQANIDAEASTRATAITTEASARSTADTSEATARAAADALLVPLSQKGAANGVATLGSDSKIPSAQLPAIAISDFLGNVASQAAMLALSGQRGDWAIRTDTSTTWLLIGDDATQLANWKQLATPADAVLSVNGQAGVVTITAAGLSDLTEAVQDIVGGWTGLDGAGLSLVYDDAANTLVLAVNVDGATLEVATDVLRLKDAGTTNAKLANMAQATVKGRAAGAGTGAPVDLTVTQLKALLALSASDISGLGTAAALNVPASGNAAAGEVVKGSDGRLSDARTPTTHSHAEADVTSLVADLAGKAQALTPTAVKTSAYTAAAGDLVPVSTASGAVTITLPTAPADLSRVAVKHVIQTGTNAVTINCGGTDVFNVAGGATTGTLALLNQELVLVYKASTGIWYAQSALTLASLDLRFAPASGSGAYLPLPSGTAGTGKAPVSTGSGNATAWTTVGGSVATDVIYDAKGDLPVGTGADTAARIAVGSNGQGLIADSTQTTGMKWDRLSSVVDESHADVSVVNSTTETPVANLSLPGGALAAGDLVRLTVWADYLNNSGGAVTYAFKVKIGTTTAITVPAVSQASSVNRHLVRGTVDIAIESTTAQRVGANLVATAATAGTALPPGTANAGAFVGYGTATEDTSTSKAVQLTATLGTAATTADFVVHAAILEVIKKR